MIFIDFPDFHFFLGEFRVNQPLIFQVEMVG